MDVAAFVGKGHFPEKVRPTNNEKKCGVPNGTRQTTEHALSFVIDLLVEAA